MNKSDHSAHILKRFPSERYKQFSYQTRPFTTIVIAVVLAILGVFNIVNAAVISWLLSSFVLDNVALTPIMTGIRAISHLSHGRKTLKAKVMLFSIVLSLIVGGGAGYFILATIPAVTYFASNYIALTSCSPFLISVGAMCGGYFSHVTHKLPLFWGIFIGSCLASIISISIPITCELVYFSAVATAFFVTIVAKQLLRFYFKQYYNHSNADGYEMARNSVEQRTFTQSQANLFSVSHENFMKLTNECREKIVLNKEDSTWYKEFLMNYLRDMGDRRNITDSYKNIYLALMDPNLSPEKILLTKQMIFESRPLVDMTIDNKKKAAQALRRGALFCPDVAVSTLVHAYGINAGGGFNQEVANAFYPQEQTRSLANCN